MCLKQWVVHILVKTIAALFLIEALRASKFGLHFVFEVIVHDEFRLARHLNQLACRLLISLRPVLCLLQISGLSDNLSQHFQVLVLDIKHAY